MEDNVPYLVVREIEETEFIKLSPSEQSEDTNYEISDSESGSTDDESETDFDIYESHWFPSLTRGSIIEYLDDNDFEGDMDNLGTPTAPFQNMISAVDAIIEESSDSDDDDEFDDFVAKASSTRKRGSPEKNWSRRRSKAQKPNFPTETVEIEVIHVQL
jgi:hypothetical protein